MIYGSNIWLSVMLFYSMCFVIFRKETEVKPAVTSPKQPVTSPKQPVPSPKQPVTSPKPAPKPKPKPNMKVPEFSLKPRSRELLEGNVLLYYEYCFKSYVSNNYGFDG